METGHSIESTQSKVPAQYGVAISFLITSGITTGVRFWVRRRMIHSLGLDDYFMILSTLFITAYAISLLHISNIIKSGALETWEGLEEAAHFVIICEATYLQTVLWLKLSLGFFFLRIVNQKWQKHFCYGIMIFSTLVNITDTFYVIFMCGDPHFFLKRYITGQCTSHKANLGVLFTHAGTTTLTDLMFAVLPIFVLWHVQMNRRKKLSVGFILGLGLIGTICSAVRFNYIEGLLSIDDFFWSASSAAIWSMIEPGTGIIAANLATMRPLFKQFLEGAKRAAPSATAAARRMSRSFKHSIDHSRSSFLNASLGTGVDRQRDSLVPPHRLSQDSDFGVTTTCIGGSPKSQDIGGNGFGSKISSAMTSIRRPDATLQGVRGVGKKLTSAVGSLTRGRNERITVGWDADPEKDGAFRGLSPYGDIQKEVDVDIDVYDPNRRRSSMSSGKTLVDQQAALDKILEKSPSIDTSRSSQETYSFQEPLQRRVTFLDDTSVNDVSLEQPRNQNNSQESTFDEDFRRLYGRFLGD